MPGTDPITGVANAISEATKAFMAWFSSKRIRYSLEANKIAHLYIQRTKKLYGEEDKTLAKYEKKFYKLTTSE